MFEDYFMVKQFVQQSLFEVSSDTLESRVNDPEVKEKESKEEYWARIARIALPRFPELQRGERISYAEIRRVLRELENGGYHVGDYQSMDRDEMFNLLVGTIRPHVGRRARRYCPKVEWEISRRNQSQKARRI